MPDFDKDLRPIIKDTSSPDFTVDARGVRNTPMPIGSTTATPDLSETPSVFDKLNMYASQTKTGTVGAFVSNAELSANKRYPTYNPTIDNQEDFAAYGQSGWDKAINGTLKGTNLAATTVAGGFAALGGLLASPFTGKLSTIWDNPVMNALDKWNEKVDNELLPNYYSDIEKDASWYSTDNWMTTNFLFDKLIKNSGFAVGAMYGGNIANAGLLRAGLGLGKTLSKGAALAEAAQAFTKFTPYLRNAARAVSVTENLKAYEILASKIGNIAELEANAAALGESAAKSAFGELATSTNKFNAFNDAARRTAIATYSSGGEASFEALQTSKALRENLIQDYKDSHGGLEPEGKDLDIIENNVSSIGKASFLGNLAVLAFTENLQLPKLLGSSYSSSRQVATSLVGKVDDVVKRDVIWGLADMGPTTKFGKVYSKVTGVGKYVFDPKEAGQEGLQYALQVGAQNYYNKAYRTDDANFLVDGVLYGLEKTLTDKEGIEGMLLGGLTGGPMQAMGTYKEDQATAKNTQAFLQDITRAGDFKDAFIDRLNSINRAVVLQQQQQDAILIGDKLEAKDLETDQMHNYLATRIKYGRFDMVKQDIDELRRMSMTKQGLEELKAQGIGNINDDINSFQKRLNEFERTADYTNELYKATNLAYSGVTSEDGSRKYSDDVIDKMVYAASKIADYDVRIPEVNSLLSDYGISTSEVLDLMFNKGKSDKQSTKEALDKVNALEETINGLDTIKTVKDELKTQLSDVMEMSARRKLYLSEYDEMVNDPEYFTLPDSEKEAELAKVKQIKETEEGKKKSVSVDLEVGKEYSLTTPVVRNGNKINLNPKIKILSKTLGGEFEVQLPNGAIEFMKPVDFKDYTISEDDEYSKENNDAMINAISSVLGKDIPEDQSLEDTLNAINKLNDSNIVDRILEKFNDLQKSAIVEKQKIEKELQKILANKKQVQTLLSSEDPVGQVYEYEAVSVDKDSRKPNLVIPSSTIASQNIKGYESSNLFGANFHLLPNKDNIRGILITKNNEKEAGAEGLIDYVINGAKDVDANQVIVMVMVDHNNKTKKFKYIDVKGEATDSSTFDNLVFQVMPLDQLRWSEQYGSETMFRSGTPTTIQNAIRNEYKKFRDEILASKNIFPYQISPSFGIPQYDDQGRLTSATDAKLIENSELRTKRVLKVPTTETTESLGYVTYNNVSGKVFIKTDTILSPVQNQKHTEARAKLIYKALHRIAETLQEKTFEEEGMPIVNWLRTVVYWGLPNDQNGDLKRAGRNSIFFDTKGLDDNNIFKTIELVISNKGDKFQFTPDSLEANKNKIVDIIQDTFHNVYASRVNGKDYNTEYIEITDILPDGTIKSKRWDNYQSYLLSSEGRETDDIPLVTPMKPVYGDDQTNREGIYFVINNNEDRYKKATTAAKGAEEAPLTAGGTKQQVPLEEKGPTQQPKTQSNVGVVGGLKYGNDGPTRFITPYGPVDFRLSKFFSTQGDPDKAIDFAITAEDSSVYHPTAVEVLRQVYDNMQKSNPGISKTEVESSLKHQIFSLLDTSFEEGVIEAPQETKSTDDLMKELMDNGDDIPKARMDVNDILADYDIEDWKEVERFVKTNFPKLPVGRVMNMLKTETGRKAFGLYKNGMVFIYQNAEVGTVYHEIFHAVMDMFTTPQERAEILNEVRNRKPEYTNLTDRQLEEIAAEDARNYFQYGNLPEKTQAKRSWLANFLTDLARIIKEFFFGKQASSKLEAIFKKMGSGYYKDYASTATNQLYYQKAGIIDIDELAALNDDEMFSTVLSSQEEHDTVQHMIFTTIATLIDDDRGLQNIGKLNKPMLMNNLQEAVRKRILTPAVNARLQISELSKTEADNIKNKEKIAKLKAITDNIEQKATDVANPEVWARLSTAYDNKLSSLGISYDEESVYISNDPYRTGREDYQDARKIDNFKNSSMSVKLLLATLPIHKPDGNLLLSKNINGVTLLPMSEAFMAVMNTVHSSRNINDMMEGIRQLALSNPNYTRLYSRLTNGADPKNNLSYSNLKKQHHVQLINSFWRSFKKQNPDVKNVYVLQSGEIVVGESNFTTAARQTADNFENKIKGLVKKDNPYFKYKAFDNDTKQYVRAWYGNIENPELVTQYKKDIPSMVNFLKTLDIPFNTEDIEKLDNIDQNKFKSATTGLIDTIASSSKEGKKIVTVTDKVLNIKGRLLDLAEIDVKINNPEFSSTYYNINGERVQTFIGVNLPSELFNTLSKITNIKQLVGTDFEYLLTDSFSKYSVLIDKMFDKESGNRNEGSESILKPAYLDGYINAEDGRKIESSKLTQKDRLISEMNANLKGYYSNLVPGDAAMEWMLLLDNHFKLEDMSIDGFEKIHSILKGYFISEADVSRDKNRSVELGNGRKMTDLRFFKTILKNTSAKGEDQDLLHNEIVETLTNSRAKAEKIYKKYEDKIKAASEKYLTDRATSLKSTLTDYGVIERDVNNLTSNVNGLALQFTKNVSDKMILNQLIVTEANYMINNIELHKIIYSDPYQYEDELKRIKNFNSPRQALSHGSADFNARLEQVYNQGLNPGDIGYIHFTRDFFTSATYEDVKANIAKLLGYEGGYKETDGSGMISFPAYRRLRILADNWNEEEERQFQYDIAYEKLKKGMNLSELEKELYELGNPHIRSAYTTIKPIVAGNKGTKINEVLLDKFALMPLSYRIIDEIGNEETTNAMRLYKKMQKEDVDYIVFKSARKVGAGELNPVYDEEGKLVADPYKNIIQVPTSIMSIQTEVPSKTDEKTTQGSQMTKLVTIDFMEAGIPVDFKDSSGSVDFTTERMREWFKLSETQKTKRSPLYAEIKNNQKLLEESIDAGYKNLLKKMGIKETKKGFEITDFSKITTTLREEMFKREVNDNVIKAVDNFLTNNVVLEATPAYQQIRNILYSIADKNVISRKISGGMKVQIPSTFLEKIRGTKDEETGAYHSDVLKFYNDVDEKGKPIRVAEVMVGRWFPNPEGLTDAELIKKLNKELLSGVAFRIPTQKQNSIDRYVIKGFLPFEYGDNVIVPSALVNKAGSDFDIDKLTMYFKNVFYTGDTLEMIPFYGYGDKAKAKLKNLYLETVKRKIEKIQESMDKKQNWLEMIDKISKADPTSKFARKWNPILYQTYDDFVGTDGRLDYAGIKEYVQEIIAEKGKKIEELSAEDVQVEMANEVAEAWYIKSLQNEYIKSCEALVSNELNYDQLIKPNSAEELKDLSKEILKLRGVSSFDYSNPGNMMNRVFMSRLRNAFISGKNGIGIAAVNQTNHSLNQRQLIYVDSNKLSSLSDKDKRYLRNDLMLRFRKFNKIEIDGKEYINLSMIKNADDKFISDILGMFIDGYVDIAKGPWIMELGASPNVSSTWMFLIKAGVPIKDVAYFMNQPIIRNYLRNLENSGRSWLFNDEIIKDTLNSYSYDKTLLRKIQSIPPNDYLKNMISKKSFTKPESTLQVYLFMEFLKYAKMAEQMFKVTQATNYDTSTFNDPFLVFRKEEQFQQGKDTIISSIGPNDNTIPAVDALLQNSFLGTLSNRIGKIRDAYSTILKADQIGVREIVQDILKDHIRLSEKDFLKLAQKVVADLFDWSVQVDKKLNDDIKRLLLSDVTSVASVMNTIINTISVNPGHRLANNHIIKIIQPLFSDTRNSDKPNNLKLANKDNKLYDQNQIINSFKELKDYLAEEGKEYIYKDLVRAAVIQSGISSSPISFTSLLPYDDFVELYNSTLSKLTTSSNFNINDFKELGAFYRNNWANDDIVPHRKPIWRNDPLTGESYPDNGMGFHEHPQIKNAQENDKMSGLYRLTVGAYGSDSDYIVMNWEDFSMSAAEKAKRRREGDYSFLRRGLFKKVYTGTEPLTISGPGRRKYNQYVYKMINAWGDTYRVNEFYNYPKESVIDNGFEKVKIEYSDDDIFNLIYGGEELFDEVVTMITSDELLEDYDQSTGDTVGTPLKSESIEPINVTSESGMLKLRDGNRYDISKIDANLLDRLGYTAKEAGKLLKSIC